MKRRNEYELAIGQKNHARELEIERLQRENEMLRKVQSQNEEIAKLQ